MTVGLIGLNFNDFSPSTTVFPNPKATVAKPFSLFNFAVDSNYKIALHQKKSDKNDHCAFTN